MSAEPASHSHVIGLEDAHEWSRTNTYLKEGYRKNFSSKRKIIKSLFIKHNELMNVWTHILGALLFAALLGYIFFNIEKTKLVYDQLKHDLRELNFTGGFDRPLEKTFEVLADNWGEVDIKGKLESGISRITDITHDFVQFSSKTFEELLLKEEKLFDGLSHNYEEIRTVVRRFSSSVVIKLHNLIDNSTAFLPDLKAAISKQSLKELLGSTSSLETYPIYVFLVSAIICLSCSVLYHLFGDMSLKSFNILKNLDYAGISILNGGSSFSFYYYIFYCRPALLFFYSFTITVFCLIAFVVSLGTYIHRPENIKKKSIMYGGLGLWNVIPLLNMIYLLLENNPGDLQMNMGIFWVALSGVAYISGLVFYAKKFPERYYPKKFDIWLNSHVIWHCFVILGAFLHFAGLNDIYKVRKITSCSL